MSSLESARKRFRRIGRAPDPLSYIFAGLTLVSIGASFLAHSLGVIGGADVAPMALTLLGAVLIADAAARYREPWTRHRSMPYAVLGACLVSAGASLKVGVDPWWAAPLTVVGVALVINGLLQRREKRVHRSARTRCPKGALN